MGNGSPQAGNVSGPVISSDFCGSWCPRLISAANPTRDLGCPGPRAWGTSLSPEWGEGCLRPRGPCPQACPGTESARHLPGNLGEGAGGVRMRAVLSDHRALSAQRCQHWCPAGPEKATPSLDPQREAGALGVIAEGHKQPDDLRSEISTNTHTLNTHTCTRTRTHARVVRVADPSAGRHWKRSPGRSSWGLVRQRKTLVARWVGKSLERHLQTKLEEQSPRGWTLGCQVGGCGG